MQISSARAWVLFPYFLIAFSFVISASAPLRAQIPDPQSYTTLSKEQRDARDALNRGVQAFKNAQFDEAIRLFASAKQLDPSLENAPLYLATAYASQYIPGAPSEENIENGKNAVREYKEVLDKNP